VQSNGDIQNQVIGKYHISRSLAIAFIDFRPPAIKNFLKTD
jgi:hypothetical protein